MRKKRFLFIFALCVWIGGVLRGSYILLEINGTRRCLLLLLLFPINFINNKKYICTYWFIMYNFIIISVLLFKKRHKNCVKVFYWNLVNCFSLYLVCCWIIVFYLCIGRQQLPLLFLTLLLPFNIKSYNENNISLLFISSSF